MIMNRAEIGEEDKLVTLQLGTAWNGLDARFPTEMTPHGSRMSPHEEENPHTQ